MNIHDYANQHCQPRKGKEHALGADEVARLLPLLPGWALSADGRAIVKDFRFPDFRHTLGFINAAASGRTISEMSAR